MKDIAQNIIQSAIIAKLKYIDLSHLFNISQIKQILVVIQCRKDSNKSIHHMRIPSLIYHSSNFTFKIKCSENIFTRF